MEEKKETGFWLVPLVSIWEDILFPRFETSITSVKINEIISLRSIRMQREEMEYF